jgi:hypothetical protein
MKILVFLHGTIIMHMNAVGYNREEIIRQVRAGGLSLLDYASYVPVGNAPKKLQIWKNQGAEIIYLSSHENSTDVGKDRLVLKKYGFPEGRVLYRRNGESYGNIAGSLMPDVIIEDDCESIGGKEEMTITHVRPELKKRIKSIIVREFSGIDDLPDNVYELVKHN